MTEIQAVVGLVQLQKLPYILELQRNNKHVLKSGLEGCGLEFRLLHDASGDVADTLIFYLPTAPHAARFAAELAKREIGTKNLPDAVAWHFAATWRHMLPVHACQRPDAESNAIAECACHVNPDTCSCAALLQRAIALPVNIKMTGSEVSGLVAALRQIAGIVLD
jgi:dTDP-4-amino-4,6-dideoxygalactose transaminase